MRGLKNGVVALAVAALPAFAQAEVHPLDDAALGEVTGQSGVTIELQTKVSMQQFKYTDEGSLTIDNVTLGGANKSDMFGFTGLVASPGQGNDLLDNIKLNIDILSTGDAVINMLPVVFQAVDFKITTGAWKLNGTNGSTTVLNNLSIEGAAGSGYVWIHNATHKMELRAGFAIDDMSVDVPLLAMSLRGITVTGANFDPIVPQPLDLFLDTKWDIYKSTNAAGNDALAIDLTQFGTGNSGANINISQFMVGGVSLGSVNIHQLQLSNTSLRIYGH
ncbi:DUF6160 family protein [Mangrovitalea sediminis]|uniref:DUF6160 family protein n=1 Tax=Mangrovitalea sediminis TaxID=1982043 RepID=UPI000BE5ABC9|nr:DUF6160 family protein [Mangrovitalea sediminis]